LWATCVRFQRPRLSATDTGRKERQFLPCRTGTVNVGGRGPYRRSTIRRTAHLRCARLSTCAPISRRAGVRTIRLRRGVDPRGRTALRQTEQMHVLAAHGPHIRASSEWFARVKSPCLHVVETQGEFCGWEAGIRTPIPWSREPLTGFRAFPSVRFSTVLFATTSAWFVPHHSALVQCVSMCLTLFGRRRTIRLVNVSADL
jgi:hypothetical protein